MSDRLPIRALATTGADATNDTPRYNPTMDRLEFAPGGATSQTVRETFTADANDALLTLGATPLAGRVYLWLDGLLLVPTVDYTVDSADPTKYTLASALAGGETLHVSWETLDSAPAASSLVAGAATGYAAEILADSPLGYWRLGESSGTTAADASGNGRAGTYSGTPTLGTTGLLTTDSDTAVTFASVSAQHVSVPYDAGLTPTSFTAEAIIKPSVASGTKTILSRHGNNWTFRMDGDRLGFYVWYSSGSFVTCQTAVGSIAAGVTHHVVAVWENAVASRIYIDGVQQGFTATTQTRALNGTPELRIAGALAGSGEYFDGVVDEAVFYGTALSATRIAAHYAAA